MMNAPGATENACTRGVVYTLVDFTLTLTERGLAVNGKPINTQQ
jgi:hypothetical protein